MSHQRRWSRSLLWIAPFLALALWGCHDHDHDHGKHGDSHKTHGKTPHKDDHGSHAGEVKLTAAAMKQVKLQIIEARPGAKTTQEIAAVGRLSLPPLAISRIGSRAAGRVLRLFVSLGQKVRRGQSLVLLDSPTVGVARARYLRALALLRLAEIERKRTRRLKKIGVASAKELLAAAVARQRAQIGLRAARAQLDVLGVAPPRSKGKSARISGRFTLRAPLAGEVTALPRSLGAWVGPQDTVVRLEQRKKVWALLEIYARDLPDVRVGQNVHLYGPGIHHHLEGRISYLASRFERGAQTLEARVVLANPKEHLRPGQFVYGLIQRRPRRAHPNASKASRKARKIRAAKGKGPHAAKGKASATKGKHPGAAKGKVSATKGAGSGAAGGMVSLPEDAIQRLGQQQIVFVVGDAPGHFRVRSVVAVEAPHGFVRILHGLKVGEKVVAKGSFLLKSELMRASLESEHGHAH